MIPTLLKMKFEGGEYFSQWSTFLVIPYHWQTDENQILALSSGGAKHISDWSSTCVGWHPSKNCAAIFTLALSSSGGAKRKYFLTSAQGLSRTVTLKFHLSNWITIPGFPSKKKWNSTGWFCPLPPSPSIGVGIVDGLLNRNLARRFQNCHRAKMFAQ